ncbi:DUF1801 domain-containing protein [Hyphococcus formosus]|uniref:YdeI/OmpD-associated family protein n=1 Tax=Hyphococcus formosus TaxID=3143534 RepID=UPI00398B2BC1
MAGTTPLDKMFSEAERWRDEGILLRDILLECPLNEEIKWAKPCYTHNGNNIAIIQRMKNGLALMFFKGAVLSDPEDILEEPGPNSRSGKRIMFTEKSEIADNRARIKRLVNDAIKAEADGRQIPKQEKMELAKELIETLSDDPKLKSAFDALTPGRQRGYNLYFSAPKQSKTRFARIDKYRDKILSGKGFHDR